MKVTTFIRKTAKKSDTNSMATIYFRLRDGNKDINGASEMVITQTTGVAKNKGTRTALLFYLKRKSTVYFTLPADA